VKNVGVYIKCTGNINMEVKLSLKDPLDLNMPGGAVMLT